MSRYTLLLLLNLPFILAAILSAVTQYKLGRSSRRRLVIQVVIWVVVLIGLALAQPIYVWLFNNEFTNTEPLSLFDVVQITAIVITFYVANRARLKTQVLERRVQDLHQELSIRLSRKE
jgi:hypothetical protein